MGQPTALVEASAGRHLAKVSALHAWKRRMDIDAYVRFACQRPMNKKDHID